MWEKDRRFPRCASDRGCLLPEVGPTEARAVLLFNQIVSLRNVVDPGTILGLHGATTADLELLMVVEEEMEEHRRTSAKR
jgi:hypothetical protein